MATDLKVLTAFHAFACRGRHGDLVEEAEKTHRCFESGRFESRFGRKHRFAVMVAKGAFLI